MAWAVEMASYCFLCPLVRDVVAMSIEADVEGVLCLPNVLLSALHAIDQVDHVPCLADKPVASHFNSPGHSLDDLRISVLEVMRSFDESLRRQESYWIKKLRSLHPGGMNLDT